MLQQTIEEQERYRRWHRRTRRAMTPRRLLQESDELLFWVEECLVQQVRIVPGWLVPRLMTVLRHAHPQLPARLGRERRPEEVMELMHGMGGLTYLPHPLDRHRANFRPERVMGLAQRIDIIETYNPWCDPAANQAAARLAEDLGKVSATGSDSHSAEELGRCWMEMEEYSGEQDFLEKLRYARHVVTASSGTGRRA